MHTVYVSYNKEEDRDFSPLPTNSMGPDFQQE